MANYFINFCGTACSLAVEKEMHGFIRDNYDAAIIAEDAIPMVVERINSKIREYFLTHRGKPIECSAHKSEPRYYINVGQMYMTLTRIEHEIGATIV